MHNMLWVLEHPVEDDDTSLTIQIQGNMKGTYDVKSFTEGKRLEDNSIITGREVSQLRII